ncbi:DUF3152 domain-containing protein [Ruania alba]|nr:DUF3152 domain-containing protein [Ruania alba]
MTSHESRRKRVRFVAPVGLLVLLLGMVSAEGPSAIPDPDDAAQTEVLRAPVTSRGSDRDPAPSDGREADPTPTAWPSMRIPDWPGEVEAGNESAEDTSAESEQPEEPELTAAERADQRAGVLDREVPRSASGQLLVVDGETAAPEGADRVIHVRVEVEDGLAVEPETFAAYVMTVLNDPRGWGHDGSVAFARTDGDPDMRVVLASPDLTDELCAPLDTGGEYSCGREGHAVLNAVRWAQSTDSFLAEAGIGTYRQYLVTHEVGHLLGYPHEDCPGAGERAPVMQQQTITLDGCTPNGWVAP